MRVAALLAVCGAGFLLSIQAARLARKVPRCADGDRCGPVMGTRYARLFLGLPSWVLAYLYFAAVGAWALVRLTQGPILPIWPVAAATALALAACAYLAWALFLKLKRF